MKIGRRNRAPAKSPDDAKPVVEQPAPELQRSNQPKLAIAAGFSSDADDTDAAAKLAAEVNNEHTPEVEAADASWYSQWSPKLDKSAIVDFVQGKLDSSNFLITSAQSRHAALSQEARATLYSAPLLLLGIAYLHKRRTQRSTRAASTSDNALHYKTTPTRTNSASSAASTSNCFSSRNQAATQAAAAEHTEHAASGQQASLLTPIAAPPRLRRACPQTNTVSPARELIPAQAAAAVLDDMQDVLPASAAAVSDDNSAAAYTAIKISAAQALKQLLVKSSSTSTTAAAAALQSVSQRSIVFVRRAAFLGMGQLLSFKQCAAQALHVRGDDVLYVAAKPASKGKRAYA
jgi:hypothetical protein